MRRTVFWMLGLVACEAKEEPSGISEPAPRCESSVEMHFPNGDWAAYDGCNDVLVDATYEFDPDDPPEIRSFRLQLTGADDSGFECWVVMTARGLCGPGFYEVGDGASTQVAFETLDCGHVPDEWEASFAATDGLLLMDTVSGGTEVGDHTGERLYTELVGSIEASTGDGTDITVSFDIGVHLIGEDAEEAECRQAD